MARAKAVEGVEQYVRSHIGYTMHRGSWRLSQSRAVGILAAGVAVTATTWRSTGSSDPEAHTQLLKLLACKQSQQQQECRHTRHSPISHTYRAGGLLFSQQQLVAQLVDVPAAVKATPDNALAAGEPMTLRTAGMAGFPANLFACKSVQRRVTGQSSASLNAGRL
eukprot:GHRR01026549.1.p1 GENE.GHRR01026549.1~~GHRR01026549.1.p1  ORF type:complete len:165 (+),score=60.64 GHRR01026549.1:261-755(+)